MSISKQVEFFKRCPNIKETCDLLELIPDIYVIVKDHNLAYVYLNHSLVLRLGRQTEKLIGKTDEDLYQSDLANLYRQEDMYVLQSTKRISGEIHQAVERDGTTFWLHTEKKPIYDNQGNVVGVIGMMRDCQTMAKSLKNYRRMEPSLEYIKKNFNRPISIEELADTVQMSPSHFQRLFRKNFSLTPIQQVNQTRIREARNLLLNSDETVTEIALLVGYFDHSHFCKQFKQALAVTPSQFRQNYRRSPCA